MYLKSFTLTLLSSAVLLSNATMANSLVAYKETNALATIAYWTPERMAQAKSLDLPSVDRKNEKKLSLDELRAQLVGEPIGHEGAPPSVHIKPDTHPLFQPIPDTTVHPLDVGTLGEQFTSAELTPTTAVLSYPYRAAGKLFFTTPSGNATCSAAAISPRIVLTAGHCVSNGTGNFYSNFMFVPAFNNGSAPYLTWTASYIATTNVWFNGGGTVPNAADWGMLEMADQSVKGTTMSIGNLVGWFGFLTLSTIPNHSTILGYPTAFDNGQMMHQVLAQSAVAVSPNNAEYGSDMSAGAGGGPWVQNFGAAASGQTGGTNPGRTRIVGVTSYGFNDTTSLGNGSSILDNTNFIGLFNFICGHQTGNC